MVILTQAEKQIRLEDIERDNLLSEKQIKQQQQLKQQHLQYLQPNAGQHVPQHVAQHVAQQPFIPSPQILPQQPAPPQYQQPLTYRYPQVKYQYVPVPVPVQAKTHQYVSPQQLYVQNDKYTPQYQFQYVAQPTQNYPQNYLYIQPVVAPSNHIPNIAQPKGVQYVMFLEPNQGLLRNPNIQKNLLEHTAYTHNLVGLLQRNAHTNVLPQNYRPAPQQPQPQQPQPTPHQTFSFRPPVQAYYIPQQPQLNIVPSGITYANPDKLETQQTQQSITSLAFAEKRQPTSLLDSYIPSVLQIQYYKQLQEAQSPNSIPRTEKFTDIKPPTQEAGEFDFQGFEQTN